MIEHGTIITGREVAVTPAYKAGAGEGVYSDESKNF